MKKRLSRFKRCDSKFYPYLEKVLNRLPGEIKEDILNNKNLQILGDEGFLLAPGMYSKFDEPITDIVYLNTSILKLPKHVIIHTIAHELAHYVAGKGKTGLHEKEAEEMVLKWGFEMESEKIGDHRPISESLGYDVGYKWASMQNDQDLIEKFGQYFEDWYNDRLSTEQIEMLYYDIDMTSIMTEMGELEGGRDINGESGKTMIMLDSSADRGVIWGVMGCLKDIFLKKSSYYNDEDTSKTDLFNTLEEIKMKFDKLFSHAMVDFIEKIQPYGIPELSEKLAEFLEDYKKN